MNTPFLIKDKVKFLQIKQDTDKNAAKNMERDSVSAYKHMCTHLIDDPFLSQKTNTFEYCIY